MPAVDACSLGRLPSTTDAGMGHCDGRARRRRLGRGAGGDMNEAPAVSPAPRAKCVLTVELSPLVVGAFNVLTSDTPCADLVLTLCLALC